MEITNFKRVTKIVNNINEFYEHAECVPQLKLLPSIVACGIDPRSLTDDTTNMYLWHYSQIKEYGISFFYKSSKHLPNKTFQAIELIAGEIAQYERDEINAIKEKNKTTPK